MMLRSIRDVCQTDADESAFAIWQYSFIVL